MPKLHNAITLLVPDGQADTPRTDTQADTMADFILGSVIFCSVNYRRRVDEVLSEIVEPVVQIDPRQRERELIEQQMRELKERLAALG